MLMRERRIVRDVFREGREGQHLDVIRQGRVERLIPAVAKIRRDRLKERVRVRDPLGHGHLRVRLRRVAVHLGRVEDGITAREEQP